MKCAANRKHPFSVAGARRDTELCRRETIGTR